MAEDQEGLPVAPPEEGTEEQHPDWLMTDKYSSVEDQAKAYPEARNRLDQALAQANREKQERERLEEQLHDLAALQQDQPAQNQFQDPNQNPFVLAYQRAVEDGDIQAQLAIQAQLMDTVVEQRLAAQTKESAQDRRGLDPHLVKREGEQIAAKFGNDEALTAKAYEIMETHPLISRRVSEIDKDPSATMGDLAAVLETAYELARGGMVQQTQQQSLAQQQAEQEKARERKLAAESLSGAGGRVASQSEQDQAWERISGAQLGNMPRISTQ